MRNLGLLLFMLVFTYCSSCDGPYKNCPQYRFSPLYLDYVYNLDANYWIYQDTTYKLTDSIVKGASAIEFNDYCDYKQAPTERYDELTYSSFFFRGSRKTGQSAYFSDGCYDNDIWFYADSAQTVRLEYFDSLYPSLTVGNKEYRNVLAIKSGNQKWFWVRRLGVIRFNAFLDGREYNFDLIRYGKK